MKSNWKKCASSWKKKQQTNKKNPQKTENESMNKTKKRGKKSYVDTVDNQNQTPYVGLKMQSDK